MVQLGQRLERRRQARRLTQSQLGSLLGMSHQTIQKYECGEVCASAASFWLLAKALDVEIEYFFEGITPFGQILEPPLR